MDSHQLKAPGGLAGIYIYDHLCVGQHAFFLPVRILPDKVRRDRIKEKMALVQFYSLIQMQVKKGKLQ